MNRIYPAIMKLGALSGCHQMPERSFKIRGYQFPLCARCTGVAAGYLVGFAFWFIYRIPVMACVVMMSVMYVDWVLQDRDVLESTNLRRFITGFLCGAGYLHLIFRAASFLINYIRG